MFYTGVGSRKTPPLALNLMGRIAHKLAVLYFTLRTGDALGADKAFRDAAHEAVVLAGDWPNNGILRDPEVYKAKHCTPAAMAIAERFHPAWHKCSDFAKRLHGRNAFQILGPNLNEPSQYCICWTPDGATTHMERVYRTGGTGTAISIADAYGVPVVNLAIPSEYQKWNAWVIAA